jgi:hypothetical protein
MRSQPAEAMRRLTVSYVRAQSKIDRLQIKLAQNLLLLDYNADRAFSSADNTLQKLKDNELNIATAKRKRWMQQLYERMLSHAFEYHPEDGNALLQEAVEEFGDVDWLVPFMLRALTHSLKTKPIRDLMPQYDRLATKLNTAPEQGANTESTARFFQKELALLKKITELEEMTSSLKTRLSKGTP